MLVLELDQEIEKEPIIPLWGMGQIKEHLLVIIQVMEILQQELGLAISIEDYM